MRAHTSPGGSEVSPFADSFTDTQVETDAMRRLLDLSGLAIARCSSDGTILYATPSFSELFFSKPSSLVTRKVKDLFGESTSEAIDERLAEALFERLTPLVVRLPAKAVEDADEVEGELLCYLTIRKVLLADTTSEIHVSLEKINSSEREVPRFNTERDISTGRSSQRPGVPLTGRYVKDVTLWELEQTGRFRAQMSAAGSWVMDIPSNTIAWSESTFLTLGMPLPSDSSPHIMGFEQWVHPDDLQRVTEELYEPLMVPLQFTIEMRAIGGDGSVRYIRAIGETYKSNETLSTPDRGFGVFIDATEQILAIRALGVAVCIDEIFASTRGSYSKAIPLVVDALTDAGGFSYAAYHERDNRTVTSSGSNRFMATEEARRVQEVLRSGTAARITESADSKETVLAVFLPINAGGKCEGVLAVWSNEPGQFSSIMMQYLDNLALNMSRFRESFDMSEDMNQVVRTLATMFGAAIESHTPFDAGRHPRIASLSVALASHLGMSRADAFGVGISASIYDMGMLWISDRITMTHPLSRTEEDKVGVRRHATIGESIASSFIWPWPVAEVMGQHHERWDGLGYPRGISGEEISSAARIVAVASAYENLIRSRPYQVALSTHDALGAIIVRSGTHYDPEVVAALENLVATGFTFLEPSAHTAGEAVPSIPSTTQMGNR